MNITCTFVGLLLKYSSATVKATSGVRVQPHLHTQAHTYGKKKNEGTHSKVRVSLQVVFVKTMSVVKTLVTLVWSMLVLAKCPAMSDSVGSPEVLKLSVLLHHTTRT